jgi:hypothetical protein
MEEPNKLPDIKPERLEETIQMLHRYMDTEKIAPLLEAMENLKSDTRSTDYSEQVITAFRSLGIEQGAVLTYAPYLHVLLSDDPFDQ